ncbi:MAG: hypothetical protein SchgKO_03590 [Schleiferiaceae bacterium]
MIRRGLLFLLLVSGFLGFSQAQNYWSQPPGNLSSVIGGAVSSGFLDNSSIYYNPGALSFSERSGLSLSADAYHLRSTRVNNGAGDDLPLSSLIFEGAPSIISGIFKSKKYPMISFTYAYVNLQQHTTSFRQSYSSVSDILPNQTGSEFYDAHYQYYNKQKEDLLGIGYGQKFTSNIGIGVSMFFSVASMDINETRIATVYDRLTDLTNGDIQGTSNYFQQYSLLNLGVFWKFGASIQRPHYNLGLTVTTPKVNLGILTGSLNRRFVYTVSSENINEAKTVQREGVNTVSKSPWNVDLSGEYKKDSWAISARIGYFANVDNYNMIRSTESQTEKILGVNVNDPFANVVAGNRSVTNAALGVAFSVDKGIGWLGGFSTDYTYFDAESLGYNRGNFTTAKFGLNQYHFSFGPVWHDEFYNINLGLKYSFARDYGQPQQVNMTDPTLENGLFGIQDNSANYAYDAVGIIFGLTYRFGPTY